MMIENSLFCVVMKTELYELKRRVVVVVVATCFIVKFCMFTCIILHVYNVIHSSLNIVYLFSKQQ